MWPRDDVASQAGLRNSQRAPADAVVFRALPFAVLFFVSLVWFSGFFDLRAHFSFLCGLKHVCVYLHPNCIVYGLHGCFVYLRQIRACLCFVACSVICMSLCLCSFWLCGGVR